MRLFLDANVLFTAAISPKGNGRALLLLAEAGACSVHSSPYAIDEARRNILAKYPQHLVDFEGLLLGIQELPEPDPTLTSWAEQHLPRADAPILAAAVSAGANVLVTGDRRHFGRLYGRRFGATEVLGLRETLERLLSE